MKKEPVGGLKSTTNSSPTPLATGIKKNYKNIKKKQSNKNICPFSCPNCQSLGGDLVKSKYEIVNILSDTGDSIFSPMHEKYHDDEVNFVRNTGQVFLSADLVNSFFQQNFKR
jgi:hypothetical protein